MPPAPSYWQDREPAATKQSPHRAAAPDTSVESPKAKHSSSKSGPPWSTGHSSNTSTPKHPDCTSTKKPSCPKQSTPDDQAKSPQTHSSRKCGHSPSPTSGSAGCKRRDLHGVDSGMVDTTLPIGSSTMDTFRSLTGSLSEVIEPLAPTITSTPLGKAGPERGRQPPLTAGTHQLHSSPAQASTYPAFHLWGLGALLPRYQASLVPITY